MASGAVVRGEDDGDVVLETFHWRCPQAGISICLLVGGDKETSLCPVVLPGLVGGSVIYCQ